MGVLNVEHGVLFQAILIGARVKMSSKEKLKEKAVAYVDEIAKRDRDWKRNALDYRRKTIDKASFLRGVDFVLDRVSEKKRTLSGEEK